ncbi:Short C-terminal domain-containing protein [Flavobacterium micromati]|uniref:Short C-terminal domain-containing protein n=1 Tax=Flavobacterium micromati TaxID=229205 RepID=A0A1M5KM58_9FLAO|nr:superinfection immunity protein [Flavobacterium micromati]SHG53851.1 Short C-terminal domain-containing protein [Flavobacterium micromati]
MLEYLAGLSAIVIIISLFSYFLPTVIAMLRGKSNTFAILLLNLFLGWTFIGWIVALVWSVTSDNKPQTIVVNNNSSIEPKNELKTLTSVGIKSEQIDNTNLNSHQDKIQNLKKLKQLLDDGILTQEEFIQQKNQILE